MALSQSLQGKSFPLTPLVYRAKKHEGVYRNEKSERSRITTLVFCCKIQGVFQKSGTCRVARIKRQFKAENRWNSTAISRFDNAEMVLLDPEDAC